MSAPVLTFFNNKGGVGKTSLVYHVSYMMAELGYRVLVCDLDPQANLTAAFLDEDTLENLWSRQTERAAATIFQCLEPLTDVGDLKDPQLISIDSRLHLLPGDMELAGFEDSLSAEWPNSLGGNSQKRAFRLLAAFWSIMQRGADACDAEVILVDVGPNLGAINRSALIASDFLVVPLGADLFSLQGLRNLGPTLDRWRKEWRMRLELRPSLSFELPDGAMRPIGYVVQQHGVRLSRPVKAYDRWVNRIPAEYRRNLLHESNPPEGLRPSDDPNCIATLKHYRSLVPLAQEARRPIFELTAGDGAIGGHSLAVRQAFEDFRTLALDILGRIGPLRGR